MRVLVVEDNEDLRVAVSAALRSAALAVDSVADLTTADEALFVNAYDCVVFDRMLPEGDSIDYVRDQRRVGWNVPVLFLTARDSLADRVDGFESGGDDYVMKPFATSELTVRVLSLCRRAETTRPSILRFTDLEVDCGRREVRRAGVLLTLTAKEFAVLEHLMTHPDTAVSRADLVEHCWDSMADPASNVVDVIIRRLRLKLREPELITSVRGSGYRLTAAV